MSVSSILKIHFPPCFRAKRWLYRAILSPPRCRGPVGEGAKRNRTMFLVAEAEWSRTTVVQFVTGNQSGRPYVWEISAILLVNISMSIFCGFHSQVAYSAHLSAFKLNSCFQRTETKATISSIFR